MRELALAARQLAGSSTLADVLSQLSAVGADGPRLALHMAMAARDLAYIDGVLAGPDPALRRAALRAVRTLPVSDAAIMAALADAPTDLRRAIYRTLRHTGRTALADGLLPEVRARWGDREAAALLPACSTGVVARLLPELLHVSTAWRAIGRGHPLALLDAIDGVTTHDYYWWRRYRRGFSEAARLEPQRALDVLDSHLRGRWRGELSPPVLRALIRCDAARTASMVSRTPAYYIDPAQSLLLAHRPVLPTDAIVGLISAWQLPHALPLLPPGLREGVYDAVLDRDADQAKGLATQSALRWLPAGRAAAEARRMLEWHGSVWHSSRRRLDDPMLPLRLTAHLPFEEAVEALTAAAYGGDARMRGAARALLIECAVRTGDPATLRVVLDEVARRTRHEQDPVRAEVLEGIALLRIPVLEDGLVPALTLITDAVVRARDTSDRSMYALRRSVSRVIQHCDANSVPALMDWAFETYARLIGRFGYQVLRCDPDRPYRIERRYRRRVEEHRSFDSGRDRLDRVLPRGAEVRLLAALEPHLSKERERHSTALAMALVNSFGRRADRLDELQDDLRAHDEFELTVRREHWERFWFAELARRDGRLARLLIEHPRLNSVHDLWRVVARERSDLLTLTLAAVRTEDDGWVPAITASMASRWTESQRDHVREVMGSAAKDTALPVDTRLHAVRTLGLLPGSLATLAELADQEDIPIAEAALDAAARVGARDCPVVAGSTDTSPRSGSARAMALLLDHAAGSTSAAAVAAMARCARSVRPSVLGPLLVAALTGPDRKITVRKQAARLLERHRVEPLDVLLRQWNQPDLHGDVRTALAVALQHWPENPRALDALLDAAAPGAGELLIRTLCQTGPLDYAPADRPRYAVLARRLLTASDDPGVRFRTTRAFSSWATYYTAGCTDLIAAVSDPADPRGADELPILLALFDAGVLGDEILPVLDPLLTAPRDDTARHRARSIIGHVTSRIAGDHPTAADLHLAAELQRRLATHPLFLEDSAALALHLLPFPTDPASAEALSTGLLSFAALLHDRPLYVTTLTDYALARHFTRRDHSVPAQLMLPAATALTEHPSLPAQLLSLALIATWAPRADWSPQWRRLLDHLRASAHLEIEQRAWNLCPCG
ncbi:hypothetical protein [Nocardia aurantiaca]|uniref:HEAT repeat domain-containing protein n=1 Tax=Nocardia aurantiaca TaxID=2675850 RepID=A0A6I3KPE7_9NOCA|nr:hypothetical protein [Nocardia aurantiaca]MTE12483.1 hypothetical protein [Nocardia aurantiaca]